MPAKARNVSQTAERNTKAPIEILDERMARLLARQHRQYVEREIAEASKLHVSVPALCQRKILRVRNAVSGRVPFGAKMDVQTQTALDRIDGIGVLVETLATTGKNVPVDIVIALDGALATISKK